MQKLKHETISRIPIQVPLGVYRTKSTREEPRLFKTMQKLKHETLSDILLLRWDYTEIKKKIQWRNPGLPDKDQQM